MVPREARSTLCPKRPGRAHRSRPRQPRPKPRRPPRQGPHAGAASTTTRTGSRRRSRNQPAPGRIRDSGSRSGRARWRSARRGRRESEERVRRAVRPGIQDRGCIEEAPLARWYWVASNLAELAPTEGCLSALATCVTLPSMRKYQKRARDPSQPAKVVVDIATGQQSDPTEDGTRTPALSAGSAA